MDKKYTRILLAENNASDRHAIEHLVKREGLPYELTPAATVAEILAQFRQSRFDLALINYQLTDGSTLDLPKQVNGTPCIYLSDVFDPKTNVKVMKAGAYDFLVKDVHQNYLQLLPIAVQAVLDRKQAQVQITCLQGIINNLNEIVLHFDKEGQVIYANSAITRILGYTPQEVMGDGWHSLMQFDTEQIRALQTTARGEHPPANSDKELFHKDRRKLWVAWKEYFESGGELVCVVRNITERKQAKQEIRRRNRELALLNRIIAVSTSESEPESVLETACRELARAFNVPYTTATLLNREKTEARIVAEYMDTPQKAVLGKVIGVNQFPAAQYLLTHKAPLAIENAQQDPRAKPLQGLAQLRGTVSLLMLPLIIEDEVIGSLTMSSTEIRHFSADEVTLAWSVSDQIAGALKRAKLDQERRLLSTAIEQAAESVVITNTEGTILYVNPAFKRNTGYRRREAIGQNTRILNSGKHPDSFYKELWESITAGKVWHGRIINKKKDGSLCTEDVTISPVQDENKTIVNYVSLMRDVTRELELEAQYHQAQKMEAVGRLAGGIAHDFNNLLTAIMGYAGLALMTLEPDHPAQGDIQGIQNTSERAGGLTRQLLTFARRQVIEPQIINLNELIINFDKMLRRLISEDIEMVTLPAPNLGYIKADPGQIEQVLVNLVVNARDAMPNGGKLTIETSNTALEQDYTHQHAAVIPGNYIMLAVSDNGMGMTQEIKSRIFEPFFTTKEEGKGTGLGLATCFGIVKQSDGHIWVYSEPRQGTTFRIYLPQVETAAIRLPKFDSFKLLPQGTETILLVEDEIAVRSLAARILRDQGYTVLEANNGEDALNLVRKFTNTEIHLLLTDVVMPRLGGKALSEQLKVIRPDIKVLFTSGYTGNTVVHHNVLDTGTMFLQKPFLPTILARKVRDALDADM